MESITLNIRSDRLVYFLAYAFELMLFAARGQFIPMGVSLFGISGWTIAQYAHTIASLVFMLLWSKRFKPLIGVSIALMIVGFIPFLFMPVGIPRLIFGIVFYIGLGGAVTSARCGYAFAANNTERLVGILFMFVSVALIRFVRSLGAEGVVVSIVLPLILLLALCYCLLRFKPEDFEVNENPTPGDKRGLYWAFAFFALYFAFDGYNASLTDGYMNPDFVLFFIGMLIAALILYLVVAKFKVNTWHVWNIFFIASFCMGIFAFFATSLGTEKPQYFFGGLSMIGWPLCIYTLGCAQRRFASYALLKKCTALYVVLSPIIILSSDLVESFAESALPLVCMLFVLVFGIGFLMVSPFSYKYLFSAVWIHDIFNSDMQPEGDERNDSCDDRFAKYGLSPRQGEILEYLLAAKTGRQIAGELGLSESTIKMHISELYKKLGISSRSELFLLFGLTRDKIDSTHTKV